jgi:hypothetical protein
MLSAVNSAQDAAREVDMLRDMKRGNLTELRVWLLAIT